MKEFYLPIEDREENLDRACEIARSQAHYEGEPVYTSFIDVPLVAVPGEDTAAIRANWRKLFEQFQAGEKFRQVCGIDEACDPEPKPAKKWYEKPWFAIPACLIATLLAIFVLDAISVGIDALQARHRTAHVVTYDKRDASITINFDEWKKSIGCKASDFVQMDSTSVGSEHGNVSVKFTPYCITVQ